MDAEGRPLPESSGRWQPLADHLRNVAALARRFAEPLGLAAEAELAGLLHDLGKYRPEFQAYLRGERAGSNETQHAVFGASWAWAAELVAAPCAVAGHHAGLHNRHELEPNVTKPQVTSAVQTLVERLQTELGPLPKPPGIPAFLENSAQPELAADVYVRFLFSCLVDADRLDTAHWPDPVPEDRPLDASALLARVLEERDRKQAANPNSPLAVLRNRVFDRCLAAGAEPPGFFSLTVPTGGGKTLASMAFALAHAREHGLRRVIVVIPYLSIIEQNAAEYRRILGDDVVAELHSAVEPPADVSEQEKDRLELVAENWDAPIIVTSSVQFLETLFAASPARCRKLHRMARSVVIFDEVQTMPLHLLAPTFSVLRELQRNYGVSFIFSSATQPAFRKSPSLPDGFGPDELRPILSEAEQREIYRALRRVRYHLPRRNEHGRPESLDWPALAERLAATPQVLCVVNLTRHAAMLWEELCGRLPERERPIHLSAAMCPAHRLALIYLIKRRLKSGQPCRVVSTQLIEAGVDVDFPVVWRAFGPLDAIVQVAGRCNREGRLAAGEMHVFQPVEAKLPGFLYEAAAGQAAIQLDRLASRGDVEELLATDPTVFAEYFQALWQSVPTDKKNIQEDRKQLRFRTVAHNAKVIDDDSRPVIVPIGKARRIIRELRDRQDRPGHPRFTRDDLRRLQRFMVNVRSHRFRELKARQLIRPLLPNLDLFVLNEGLYHRDLGLVIEHRPLEDFLL
ncbi:CRISPR-associated endonuclease Cas3'' [Limisphaera sp. VF-2]|uniref:CRISPR-associated endonuclease Cas3'' n=1 Tax=Limisphaera sp. VF-2 TaxID=3400418 RepID=UPI003C24C4A1